MARKSIKQRIEFDGADKMQKDLLALGKTGEKAFAEIQKAALKVDFTRLTTSLKTFGGELASFGRKASLALAGFGLIGGLSFAGTTKALADLAKSAGEVADQTGKAAEKAGISTEAFSKLAFAAEQSDVSQEQLVTAFTRLNKQIGAAAGGNKNAVALFNQLGVAIKDSQGNLRPTEDIVHDLADAFAKLPNGVKKSTLVLQLFGKAGALLIPFLNEGKAGILELEKQAEQLGITLTDAQAKIGDALGDSLDKVTKAVGGIRLQLGLAFAPAFTKAADLFTQRIVANRQAIVSFGVALATRVGPIIDDIINTLSGNDAAVKNSAFIQFREQTIQFGTSAKQAITGIVIPAFNALLQVLDQVAKAINSVFGTDFSGQAIGIAIAIGQLTGAFKLLRAAIIVVIEALALLARHPVVAILILLGIRLLQLAEKMHVGETAAQAHARALNELKQAVDDVKNGVPGAQERLDQLAKSHLAAAKAALADAQAQVEQQKQMAEIAKAEAESQRFGAFGSEDAKRADVESQKLTKRLIDLARQQRQLDEIKATIEGKSISQIEDVRTKAGAAANDIKTAGDAAAESLSKTGAAADDAGKKVENLGKTIKVTSFGGSGGKDTGPVTQLFDVDEKGVAKAREGVSLLASGLNDVDFKAKQADGSLTGLKVGATAAGKEIQVLGSEAADASADIDGVDDDVQGLGTTADATSTKVKALGTSLNDTSTSVIHVKDALGQVTTETTNLGAAADDVALKITAAVGETDVFATASNNAAGLGTALDTTRDSAAGLGTALADTGTAAEDLGTSFSDAEQSASQAADAILAPFQAVATGIGAIFTGVGGVVSSGFQALQASIAAAAASVSASIERILSQLRAAAAAAARLQAQAGGGGGGQAARAGFASGGHVRGPGTATSDSILAMLSDGEFVMKTAAVRKYGLGVMAALNSLRLPSDLFAALRGFNAGGLVESLTSGMKIPRLANGGVVQQFAPAGGGFTQPVHLHFEQPGGGEATILVMAKPQDALAEVAAGMGQRSRNSTGRGQSWRGRRG